MAVTATEKHFPLWRDLLLIFIKLDHDGFSSQQYQQVYICGKIFTRLSFFSFSEELKKLFFLPSPVRRCRFAPGKFSLFRCEMKIPSFGNGKLFYNVFNFDLRAQRAAVEGVTSEESFVGEHFIAMDGI